MASTTETTTDEAKQPVPCTDEQKTSTEPMSERACDIKKALQTKQEVTAVLLKPNGESEEIKYDASSKAANSLLNGRPTIMGELDEAQIVMARALNQSSCGEPNTHTLPAPFGNLQFNGNYLLFRVDAEGSTVDLTLKEYKDYAETHKAEPAKATDVDSQFIKSQRTPNTANSRLTLLCIRSQMDKKVRSSNPDADETEIAALIDVELQKLVDGLVFKAGASPLTDPDYKPEDEGKDSDASALDSSEELSMGGASQTQGDSTGIQATGGTSSSEGDWRSQLNDALTLVRERGRFDGMKLAEKISSTLYEVNGVDPSLSELTDVFRKIQTEFAYEAQDELNDDDANSSDNGTAFYLRQKGTKNGEELRGADLVEYATRIVGEDLISRARSAIAIGKGRGYEPTESELRETVLGFATKMAEGFNLNADDDADPNGDGCADEDPDYDPNNRKDRQYAAEDRVDDLVDDAPLQMSKSATRRSRKGRSEAYSVYFGDGKARTGKKSVTEIVAAFVGAHGRRPNALEKERLRNFVAMQAAPETIELATQEAMGRRRTTSSRKSTTSSPSKVLVTPIKEKKASKAKGFSVYFEKQNPKAEEMAVKWFQRFNHRTPTELELRGIRSFTKADNDTFKELVFDVEATEAEAAQNDDIDSKQETIDLDADMSTRRDANADDEEASEEVSVSSLVTKATSTAYNLDFEGGDEQMAIKWFERFNQRKPNVVEMKKISKFVEEDHNEQETIDVD